MIGPVVAGDSTAKISICIIGGPLRRVDDVVLASMLAIQKICDLEELNSTIRRHSSGTYIVYGVAVKLFEPTRWIAHGDNAIWDYVGQVEAETLFVQTTAISTDQFAE